MGSPNSPANSPPQGPVLMMQWALPGVNCNDTDTAAISALATALGLNYGEFAVFGTVDLVQEGKRKPRAAITVEGHQIATATPQSSAHLIPLHATAQRDGLQLVVPVAVDYLPGQASVTVACPRAKDLPSDWFNASHGAT